MAFDGFGAAWGMTGHWSGNEDLVSLSASYWASPCRAAVVWEWRSSRMVIRGEGMGN